MSDFFHPMTEQIGRKQRTCIYCATTIEKGERYRSQSGVWEGSWFTRHYHPECWDKLAADGIFEFMPGEGERPAPVKEET